MVLPCEGSDSSFVLRNTDRVARDLFVWDYISSIMGDMAVKCMSSPIFSAGMSPRIRLHRMFCAASLQSHDSQGQRELPSASDTVDLDINDEACEGFTLVRIRSKLHRCQVFGYRVWRSLEVLKAPTHA
jgi:hypothetical protein